MGALCRDPSQLINELSLSEIEVLDFRETGNCRYSFLLPAAQTERAFQISTRCGAELRIVRRSGFLHFLRRFRRRAYLLLLPLPIICFFLFLSTRIWQIDVSGNVTLSRAEILSALEEMGVYPGVSGLHLDNPQIRSRMQEALGRLSWLTVQVHGSRALVVVRERRAPPEIVDETEAREVAAAKTGTIDKMHVLEGRALVHRGDTVLKGQTLITGILTDRQEEQRKVHAMGRVWAWTWYEKSLELPLQIWEKVYSGEVKKRYSLKIGDLRLNFYNDSSIYRDGYDKIQTENRAELFGLPLPICILKTEYRAYRLYEREMEAEESSALLERELLQWLQETAPKAEILENWFRQEVADGILRLRMLSQCREDIAVEREISAPSA